jgi:ribose transport system ATP-binding protein
MSDAPARTTEMTGESARLPGTDLLGWRRPMLEVKGISKHFGATHALDDVSLTIYCGQIHCILGENGAGKSTLGKIIGGVYAQGSGMVLLDGEKVKSGGVMAARRLGISIVFQELSLVPDLSIRANLVLGTEPRWHPFARLQHEDESARVRAVHDKLQVKVDIEQRAGDLPPAQQQLIEVAKALIHKPRLIVLDEPTTMLSAPEKRRLFSVLTTLRDDGTALALITHHIEDVDAVADHVTILRNGRVVYSFSAGESPDSGTILDKLSGSPMVRRQTRSHRGVQNPFICIDGFLDRAGNEVRLRVARGEIVGIYGVVGCGAEKVPRMLVGLGQSMGLSATVEGVALVLHNPAQARRLGVAYLPAGRVRNGILPTLSIRENLNVSLLDLYARGGVVSQRRERSGTHVQLTANAVKFSDAEDNITVLSGGNQQKVLVARTLASARNLLVLEDPTAGIDLGTKRDIHDAIRARAREGVAVVLLSNDLMEAIEIADTLYTMYAGAIVNCYRAPQWDDQGAIIADVVGQESFPVSDPPG